MPKGIVTVRWDDTKGTVVQAKHPEDLQLTADEMMRIFTSHAMGEGRAGFMSMKLEAMNIASYYTGLAARGEPQYYIAIILGPGEDAGIFEEPLTEVAKELLSQLGSKNFQDHLIKGYEKLSTYVKLTDEQRLASILLDPTRKLIFKRLTEGCLSKMELQEWLEQETGTQQTDIDLLLVSLIRTTLIKKAVVEGVTGDCIFLVRDMLVAFAPPETIMTKILRGEIKGDLAKTIRSQIVDFFKSYKISDGDAPNVAEMIADFDTYGIINQLRTSIEGKEELANHVNKSEAEVEKAVRTLKKLGVVSELTESSDRKLYFLKTDPQIMLFYPEYMIDNIRAKWASGEVSKEMAVKYLQILKEEFLTWTYGSSKVSSKIE
jgi:biotin operon repressor